MDKKRPNFDAIRQVFKKYPSVQAVYLFGSYVNGTARPDSDLDLAIVPRDSSARQQTLEIMADLVRHVYDRVDLVFLDVRDVVLRFEAVRQNRLVYQTEDFDPGTYTSRIVREYWDFLPYLAVQRQAMKQRILSHGAS
jgi:predicted nucleotidyltransferase